MNIDSWHLGVCSAKAKCHSYKTTSLFNAFLALSCCFLLSGHPDVKQITVWTNQSEAGRVICATVWLSAQKWGLGALICHEASCTKWLCWKYYSYKHAAIHLQCVLSQNMQLCDPLIHRDIVAKKQLAPIWSQCLKAFCKFRQAEGNRMLPSLEPPRLMLYLLCTANQRP